MKVNVEVVEHKVYDIDDARLAEWVEYLKSEQRNSAIANPLIKKCCECIEENIGVPVGDHYNDLKKYVLGVYDENHNVILQF